MAEAKRAAVFDQLWTQFLESSKGGFIEYNCRYAKCEFLNYLVDHKEVVLHGSPNFNLEVLEPRKASGTGPNQNLTAVYATTDAANAIFVATLDRVNISHWDFENPPNRYAVGLRDASQSFWVDGVVYILERGSFLQRGNWVCTQAAFPIGKIKVCCEDFPLLDQVETITAEENDAYHAVKAILGEVVDRELITSRHDEEGYSVVVRSRGDWIPIVRLHITTDQKSVDLVDERGNKEQLLLRELGELEKYADRLKATVARYADRE